jgi:hypothetical protein
MAHIKSSSVDGVAGVAGDTHRLVLAHIPGRQLLGAVVAGKTGGGLLSRFGFSVKGENTSFASSISHVLPAGTVAGLAGCSCAGAIGDRLLCVDGLHVTVKVVRVTVLACFSAYIVRELCCLSVHLRYEQKQGKEKERKIT